ncbi:alpha/beta fold hydrolase [Salinigranum halophilum]|uniref:alpha/beta fold hydrolase n=1 Tax=Salinigranum halophilum TaxID=2565931 RepID=UPI0010A7DAAD|nr:alpha/beta hydrolase [Salinigranum halophilum]
MREHTVARDDAPDLHVVETGPRDARPVLFVHGYSQSHLSWEAQLDADLADEFRLVAMDLRGHGSSEKPPAGDAYNDARAWADDVDAVCDTLGLDDVVIVGWSYGSLVTLDYLAHYGTDRVAGLNLVGIVCGIGTERTNDWLEPGYVDLFPDIVSTDVETSVTALERLVDLCVHAELAPADRYQMLGWNVVVPPAARDGMRDRTVSHLDLLDSLSAQTLLSHGVHDAVVSVDAAREAERLLPNATCSTYPDSGHAPFWERPERFNRELRAFVAGLG